MTDNIELESCLYPKSYNCPACEGDFKSPTPKKGKARLISQDTDLKNNFSPIDPLYYDVIACPYCGYAALSHLFAKLYPKQAEKWLKHDARPPLEEYSFVLSPEDAIRKYKAALVVTEFLDRYDSERGIIMISLAWIYRDLKDIKQERAYTIKAIGYFVNAIQKERAPYSGYDEGRVKIIVGDSLRRLGKKEDALKWIGSILLDPMYLPQHKEKAKEIKEILREEGCN